MASGLDLSGGPTEHECDSLNPAQPSNCSSPRGSACAVGHQTWFSLKLGSRDSSGRVYPLSSQQSHPMDTHSEAKHGADSTASMQAAKLPFPLLEACALVGA